jgi:hypothetical protein
MPNGYEGARQYGAYVRFYVPAGATNVTIGHVFADKVVTTEQPPAGLRMEDGWIYVAIDPNLDYGTWQLTFQYDTPYTGGVHDLYWQKQPGTAGDAVQISWTTDGRTFTAASTLTQDKVVRLGPDGVTVVNGHAGTAQLPSLGF